jgi:hypothetical protein
MKIEENDMVDLLCMQELMGSLNDVALMCPFMQVFKKPLNKILGVLQRNPSTKVRVEGQAREDLKIWRNFVQDEEWMPIADEKHAPPTCHMVMISDAAGCSEEMRKDERIGVASIGLDGDGIICFARQIFWPKESILYGKDENGKRFGSKTTTLEILGLLVPFITIPGKLKRKYVEMKVDNMACVYGWERKYVRNDDCASMLLRALFLISSYLKTQVSVSHLPRVSNWEAKRVDNMSRLSTTSNYEKELLNSFKFQDIPVCLSEWMMKPTTDWLLPIKLLKYVKSLA